MTTGVFRPFSVSNSSSTDSLLNGKRLTAADQLIRRFETRIPVNVLVSYFNEYHASLKNKDESRVDVDSEVDADQISNSSHPESQ